MMLIADPLLLTALFLIAVCSSFITTMTGGGALVVIPIMIALGIDPKSAVAIARVGGLSSMCAGIGQFHRTGNIDYSIAFKSAIIASSGAAVGAIFLFQLPSIWVERSIGLVIILLTLTSLLQLKKPPISTPPTRLKIILGYILFFFAGFIGGFSGGHAILMTYIFLLFFQKSMIESIGTRKIAGLAIAIVSLVVYGVGDIITIWPALAYGSGAWIGSYFGTTYGLKKADRWMRYVVSAVSTLLSVRLLTAAL